jgi:UDP-galactopyranose mutase
MQEKYDYLIVGSGLFGSVFAQQCRENGLKVLVLEKRDHIGGNCYTEERDGINCHLYGPHIFHTNDERIWNYINRFTEFHPYKHTVKVTHENDVFSFPINLLTLQQLWGIRTPEEANQKIASVRKDIKNPKNLEEWSLSQVGEDIYNIFIKGYTTKQWGKDPKDLPSSIIKRIPIRTNFDDSYFGDKFQGIPVGGYTQLFEKMLEGIEVKLGVNYFENREHWHTLSKKIVYTGKIDEFFDYKYGELEYRSLDFVHKRVDVEDFQGCSQMNYTSEKVPYTRITEHKHFEKSKSPVTWISEEYPSTYKRGNIPYYPINDVTNNEIYGKYDKLKGEFNNVIFGGRLSEYKYYDMHQVIGSALSKFKSEFSFRSQDRL